MKFAHPLPTGQRLVFDAANDFHAAGILFELLGRWVWGNEIETYQGPQLLDVTIEEARKIIKR